MNPCISCNFCANTHSGNYSTHPCYQVNQSPLNSKAYQWSHTKRPFSLYQVLRAITPKALWKSITKHFYKNYSPETHYRPRVEKRHHATKRLSYTNHPWHVVKFDVPPVKHLTLESPRPRVTIIGHHGPSALLRPFFPDDSELNLKPSALLIEERASNLAGKHRQLGGRTLKELSSLEAPEVSETLEDLEPLRAMSLREVTNLEFLKEHEEKD